MYAMEAPEISLQSQMKDNVKKWKERGWPHPSPPWISPCAINYQLNEIFQTMATNTIAILLTHFTHMR